MRISLPRSMINKTTSQQRNYGIMDTRCFLPVSCSFDSLSARISHKTPGCKLLYVTPATNQMWREEIPQNSVEE